MIINLTPHPVVIYPNDCPDKIEPGQIEPLFTIPGSSRPARISMDTLGTWFTEAFDEEGASPKTSLTRVSVEGVDYGSIYGLPKPDTREHPRTWYLVPLVVALAARGRSDLLVPYREVRNMQGTVIGCRQLAQPC